MGVVVLFIKLSYKVLIAESYKITQKYYSLIGVIATVLLNTKGTLNKSKKFVNKNLISFYRETQIKNLSFFNLKFIIFSD